MAGNIGKALSGLSKPGSLHLNPPSKGHKPDGAHGRAAVKALGRTKTSGNFARIEKARGKGAAISAYQAVLKKHKAGR
jgi:hypothetical protein